MRKIFFFIALCSFYICNSQGIIVDDSVFSSELLVDLLLNNSCATSSNINFSSNESVAYFNSNDSSFPIDEGIIIRSGIARNSQGTYTGDTDDLRYQWSINNVSHPQYRAQLIEACADLAYGNIQFNKRIEKVMMRRVRKAKRITETKATQLMQTNTTFTVEEAEAKAVLSVDYGDLHSEDGESSQSDSESSYSDSESSKSTGQSESSESGSDSDQERKNREEDKFEENVLASIKQENVHERRRLL